MEQFNLDIWLQDKSRKVVTRRGKPVKIVRWNSPNKTFPIVGFIDNNPTVFVWDNYGYSRAGHVESKNDIFFADEGKELTEFEKGLIDLVSGWCDSHIETPEEYINKYSQTLLDLARKELEKDYGPKCISTDIEQDMFDNMTNLQKCFVKMFKYADYHGMVNAIKQFSGLAEALIKKDLPKWKKCTGSTGPFIDYNSKGEEYLYLNDYVIKISELEKLPKEE